MLIIPLGRKGSDGIPVLTLFVCVACVILQVFASAPADRLALAFHPDQLDPLKMFTSVLMHADIWHLLGNLFFFYCFARTIEARITMAGFVLAFAVFVLGSAIPHRHSLYLGNYSVHTSAMALARGEQRIAELGRALAEAGDRRTRSGSTPVFR